MKRRSPTQRSGRARRRRELGLTLAEVVIATTALTVVVGGAFQLLKSTRDLATTTTDQHVADARVDRGLAMIERDFRSASLGTAQLPDGTGFADGSSASGFSIRPIEGWQGAAVLGDALEYRLEIPAGETEGDLIRTDGAIQTIVVTGVTAFTVARDGRDFTFTLTTRSGPDDDRARTASGTLTVVARNP